MKSTPTATQILEKYFKDCMLVTGDERDAALKAMREIASLAWDAGYRRRHDEWLKTDGETISAPDKETFLNNLL